MDQSPTLSAFRRDALFEQNLRVRKDLIADISPIWDQMTTDDITMQQRVRVDHALSVLVDLLCQPGRLDKQIIISQMPQKVAGVTRADLSNVLHAVKGDHFSIKAYPLTSNTCDMTEMDRFDNLVGLVVACRNITKKRPREADEFFSNNKRCCVAEVDTVLAETISYPSQTSDYPTPKSTSTGIEENHGIESAWQQQCRVWDDETQLNRLRTIWATADPESHLHILGEQVEHIRKHGRPARPYTKTRHGPSQFTIDEADYALFDEDEYIEWQDEGHPRFSTLPVVIRDSSTIKYHKGEPTSEWFKRMRKEPDTRIHVQTFTRTLDEISASDLSIAELDERWQQYTLTPNEDKSNNFPLNCLNIQDSTPNMRPFGLGLERFRLMTHACDTASRFVPPEYIKKLEIPIDTIRIPAAGKRVVRELSSTTSTKTISLQAADIKNCEDFLIMAQAGSVSGWHIDQCGVFTWLRILPATPSQTNDEDVIKLWPFLNMHNLSASEVATLKKGFAEHGDGWNPIPSNKIPALSLFTHDTLIQPPGTIHAPITMTECSGRGGMVMDYGSLKESIAVWKWLADHDNCSNEDLPKQTFAVLQAILKLVGDDGYGKAEEDSVSVDLESEDCRKGAEKMGQPQIGIEAIQVANDTETKAVTLQQNTTHHSSSPDRNADQQPTSSANVTPPTNNPTNHHAQPTTPSNISSSPIHHHQPDHLPAFNLPPTPLTLKSDIQYISQRITSCTCPPKGCLKNCRCKGLGIPCGVRCRCAKRTCLGNAWAD